MKDPNGPLHIYIYSILNYSSALFPPTTHGMTHVAGLSWIHISMQWNCALLLSLHFTVERIVGMLTAWTSISNLERELTTSCVIRMYYVVLVDTFILFCFRCPHICILSTELIRHSVRTQS